MIIDMEKYRHGHCRGSRVSSGSNVSQFRGAAQEIGAQAIAAQGIATAAASAPAASVLEPISFPGEVANVLKLNPVPTPFPGGGESRGTGRIYDKPHNTPRRADPITDPSLLRAVLATLRAGGKYGPRNEMIFKVGVASGRRCGDVLNLQVREVWDAAHNAVRAGIRYWDQKTRRWLAFYLDEGMRAELEAYLREAGIPLADPDAYIFPSQKKGPMSVDAYGKILDKVAEKLGLQGVLCPSHWVGVCLAMPGGGGRGQWGCGGARLGAPIGEAPRGRSQCCRSLHPASLRVPSPQSSLARCHCPGPRLHSVPACLTAPRSAAVA